jgi:type IV pilus assembly protein PilE
MRILNFKAINKNFGFTLVELMVVVVILSIIMMVALPSYQRYIRHSQLLQAQQEMQKIAEQLERHKAKNFSYKGFDASYLFKDKAGNLSTSFDALTQTVTFPLDSSQPKYKLSIIGFYAVSEYKKDNDGNITSETQDFEIKTDYLNKSIPFDKLVQADMFAIGSNWAIKAESLDSLNANLLINSLGVRCLNHKNLTKVSFTSCGEKSEGAETW